MPTPNDFTRFDFAPNKNTAGGDYSPTAAAPPDPNPSNTQVPDTVPSKQFSTEDPTTPEQLAAESGQSQDFLSCRSF